MMPYCRRQRRAQRYATHVQAVPDRQDVDDRLAEEHLQRPQQGLVDDLAHGPSAKRLVRRVQIGVPCGLAEMTSATSEDRAGTRLGHEEDVRHEQGTADDPAHAEDPAPSAAGLAERLRCVGRTLLSRSTRRAASRSWPSRLPVAFSAVQSQA